MTTIFDKKLFGTTFHIQRTLNGHSLKKVSTMLNISIGTIQRYEQGTVDEPSVDKVLTICQKYLHIPIDVFAVQNNANAADILHKSPFHIFTVLCRYLTFEQMAVLGGMVKRHGKVMNLFDHLNETGDFGSAQINLSNDTIQLRNVFNPITFISTDGLTAHLAMRNGGYEILVADKLIRITPDGEIIHQNRSIKTHHKLEEQKNG